MIPSWQMDLLQLGYDGPYDYRHLVNAIEGVGCKFWSVTRMPDKKDPDWPEFAARASKGMESYSAGGDTEEEALGKLLVQVLTLVR